MLVVAERFFCPSLELISEYLRLPPCVAGATLLSFGNGAPDVFTQLAAISQGDSGDGDIRSPGAVAMALSEPLGSGLFVSNVVLAFVIFCSGAREVHVEHRYFLKDVLFYLAGVAAVLGFLFHGVVRLWEVGLLAATYLAFMATTILLSRGDEPVHADPRLHEVPHRLRPMDSFFRESFRRLDMSFADSEDGDGDAEAPLLGRTSDASGAGGGAFRCTLAAIDEAEPLPPGFCDDADEGLEAEAVLCVRKFHQPYQPPEPQIGSPNGEVAVAEALAGSSPPRLAASPTFTAWYSHGADASAMVGDASCTDRRSWGGVGGAQHGSSFGAACGGDAGAEGRTSTRSQSGLRRELSGRPPGRAERLWRMMERPGLAVLSLFMPRIDNEVHARYRKTYAVLLPPLLPTVIGVARALLGPDGSGDGDGQQGGENAPLSQLWRQTWWQVATAAGMVAALLALRFWPRKGHLRGVAAGVATVVVFGEAMVLLDGSAGELVRAAVALGQIHGISPALLGATLLAWGNSVSDLVSNTTLARDGLPSMAITACFASPLFVLLAGLVTSLTYATRHGDMQLPRDTSLRILYGSATAILAGWALAVPLLFRFRLSRRVGALAIGAYLTFQSVYITSVLRESRAQ